ncbi:MAG: sugar phosphate isomerase, partial [Vagococcus sp.]
SVGGHPAAAGLDEGDINWRQVLQVLPQDVPVAIEYPTEKDSEILEAKELLEEA